MDAGNGSVSLRPKSFDVLRYLVEHAGRVVTKEELIAAIWPNVTVSDESLTQCISEIRRAIGNPAKEIIRTVPRRGYIVEVQRQEEHPPAVAAALTGDDAAEEPELSARPTAQVQDMRRRSLFWPTLNRVARWPRSAFALLLLVALIAGAIGAGLVGSRAHSLDGTLQGAMVCDKLPFTTTSLVAVFQVKLSSGSAIYSRGV